MAKAKREARSNSARQRWLEAIALGLLAALPTVPYLCFLLRAGVPRFGLFGDFALLEHTTRHVWSGDALLGPYSRFRWHHPGPLFFYIAAPFQALFGTTSTGLYVGTCFVNGGSAAAIVIQARLFAHRTHAVAALLVTLAWFAAFGNVTANPWNPLVIALPMTAYLVAAAMMARGESGALVPAAFFSALVMQTHIAVVTTVVATGALALVGFIYVAHRERVTRNAFVVDRQVWRRLALATATLVLLFLPPLIEQILSAEGNLTLIQRFFFVARPEAYKPLSTTLAHWGNATSWLPDRAFNGALMKEGFIPTVMRWDAMPETLGPTARAWMAIHLVLLTSAALFAKRRNDGASLALLVVGALGNAIAVTALRAIVGVSYHYLVFWTTAASSLVWIGIIGTGLRFVEETARRRRLVQVVGVLLLLGLATGTTSMQRTWFAEHPVPPASRPAESADLLAVYAELRARLADRTAVIHSEGAWDMSYATLLELEKDRIEVRVPARDRWLYSGLRSSDGLPRPLHVWYATTPLPLPLAGCLELVKKSGDISLYVSENEPATCAAR
jgi:hypothetical protein